MESTLDMGEMKKPCTCGSGKMAGNCCQKDAPCPCGSGQAVDKCCMKDTSDTPAA